uniref:ZopL4 n=1 Tax=Diffractella curvata TaxID=2819868 RepID=A0A7R6THW2_9PEZI|nr:ZopL4 [Diffractella curvata]BBU42022.1 putative hypothetical protein [Diffractella curvata]
MVAIRYLLVALPVLVVGKPLNFNHDTHQRPLSHNPVGWVHPDIEEAERDGFYFENPEMDCKYVSQPFVYKAFKTLEKDMGSLFTLINKDVHFTIVGNHPGAGVYHDLMHFYVNALRRVALVGSDHPENFRIIPKAIHGGCDQEWSVQEMNFQGISNSGTLFDIINVWVTRWSSDRKQMIEVRTYIDSMKVSQLLHENENWWNSTRHIHHYEWMPGPNGMPNLSELYALMPEQDRPKGRAPGEGLEGRVLGYMPAEWEGGPGNE